MIQPPIHSLPTHPLGWLKAAALVLVLFVWAPGTWNATQQQNRSQPHWEMAHHPLHLMGMPTTQHHLQTPQNTDDDGEGVLVAVPDWQPTLLPHQQIFTRIHPVQGPPVSRVDARILYNQHQMDPP